MSQFPPRAFIRMAAELEAAEQQRSVPHTDESPSQHELRFLSLKHVLDRLTISRSLLYELIRDPIQPFPAPVHIGRRSVWVASDVEKYMHEVIRSEGTKLRTCQFHRR